MRLTVCLKPKDGIGRLYFGFKKGNNIEADMALTRDELLAGIDNEQVPLGGRNTPWLNVEVKAVDPQCSCSGDLMTFEFDGEEKEGVVVEV